MAPRKLRTLTDGRAVTVHRNDGLRKRCGCPRRAWASCPHAWHFSFKAESGTHHRFPIDRYADHPIRDRKAAENERDRIRVLIRNGKFPPVTTPPSTSADLTFETFAEKWQTRARAGQSENQQANDKGIIKRLAAIELAPGDRLGGRPIGLVTLDDVQLAFARLGAGSGVKGARAVTAGSTVNKYRQAVLLMQRWGLKHGYLTRLWVTDPKEDLKRQHGATRERRLVPDLLDAKGNIVAVGEERRLLAHATPWLQRLIIAALETGCRRGELLALTWADVNTAGGELTIRAETSKTRTMRHLPISARLKAALAMIQHAPDGKPHAATAFVFGNAVGEQVSDPKKSWAKCCAAAGVTGLHFHDLRHEAGSRLLEARWPLHHVQKMLGHANIKTTSVYLNPARHGLHDSMRKYGTHALPDVAQSTDSERPPSGNDDEQDATKVLVN